MERMRLKQVRASIYLSIYLVYVFRLIHMVAGLTKRRKDAMRKDKSRVERRITNCQKMNIRNNAMRKK